MNLPAEELASHSRLGFQLEQAFWFYDDFYRAENRSLPKYNLRSFSLAMLERYPEWMSEHEIEVAEEVVNEFLKYKSQVPTCGAIILNEQLTKVLLVKGYLSGASWGFPKGKIAKGEAPIECAVREVAEEIGYDIGGLVREGEFVEVEAGKHAVRLYIVVGVREEGTAFQTRTRKEIGDIRWFSFAQLSTNSNKFYNVSAFIAYRLAYFEDHA